MLPVQLQFKKQQCIDVWNLWMHVLLMLQHYKNFLSYHHKSLCHNMSICHVMKFNSCHLAKDRMQTQILT